MCGICGIFNRKNKGAIDPGIIDRMLEAIRHRGPDGQDKFMDEQVGLGFNRLSFIDLTGGMQPLMNEDKDLVMVANGEIFNYPELTEELISKGHVFSTKTDVPNGRFPQRLTCRIGGFPQKRAR